MKVYLIKQYEPHDTPTIKIIVDSMDKALSYLKEKGSIVSASSKTLFKHKHEDVLAQIVEFELNKEKV